MKTSGRKQPALLKDLGMLLTKSRSFLLPSERQLASLFKVNRLTLRRALGKLEHRGIILKQTGRGYLKVPAVSRGIPQIKLPLPIGFPLWIHSLTDLDPDHVAYPLLVMKGAREVLLPAGYEIDPRPVGPRNAPQPGIIRQLDQKWSGVILLPPHVGNPERPPFHALASRSVFVSFAPHRTVNRVAADVLRGAQLAAEKLIETGARRLFFTGSSQNHQPTNFLRIAGVEQALDQNRGITLLFGHGGNSMKEGYRTVAQALKRKVKFDAILGIDDFNAMGALRACHEHGLRVPGDVQITGFGGFPMARCLTPSLSTIDCNIIEIGRESARMLLRLIRDNGTPQPSKDLPISWVAGETTQPQTTKSPGFPQPGVAPALRAIKASTS